MIKVLERMEVFDEDKQVYMSQEELEGLQN